MDNKVDRPEHPIKGYRTLTTAETDLVNRIKLHAELTRELLGELRLLNQARFVPPLAEAFDSPRESEAESARWLSISRTQLQQGFMALVRAVALPKSF